MVKINPRNKHESESSPGGIRTFLGVTFLLTKIFGSGFLVYLVLSKLIYGLQKYLYQKPGEILAGSGQVMIPGLFLVVSVTYVLLVKEGDLEERYFPRFYKYTNLEGKVQIEDKFVRKLNKFMAGLILFSVFFVVLFSNEYLSLGNSYIAASSASFFPNRKEYSYSEIKIVKERHQSESTYSWTYIYKFPDGKTISNISDGFGVTDSEIIKMINQRQLELELRASPIETWRPKNENSSKTSSYLIYAASYAVFGWIYLRILKPKNKKQSR